MSEQQRGSAAGPPAPALPATAEAVLEAAAALLEHERFGSLTVAKVAACAGFPRADVRGAFASREAMGIALAEREFAAFFDSLDAALALETGRAPLSVSRIASIVTLAVIGRPAFVRILPVIAPVIEHNLADSEMRQFKTSLLRRTVTSGVLLDRAFPAFRAGDGVRFLLFVRALVVGLAPLASPPPAARHVLAAPEFSPLHVDFARELSHALHHYLMGVARAQP